MEKSWLKWYDDGVPSHLDYPRLPLKDFFNRNAGAYPDRPYIIFKELEISYSQANSMARKLANGLVKLGVKKGDRVGLMMLNIPQFLITTQACFKLGAILVPANPLYTVKELTFQFKDSGTETVVVMAPYADKAIEILKNGHTAIKTVIVVQIPAPLMSVHTGIYSFDEIMASGEDKEPDILINSDDIAMLQYTGGTTGVPRGCALSNFNLTAISYQDGNWYYPLMKQVEYLKVLALIPLYHTQGFNCSLNLSMFYAGTVILVAQPSSENILGAIDESKPNLTSMVPAMIIGLNNHPATLQSKLSSLISVICGASPLPLDVLNKFEQLSGCRIIEGYGLAESSNVLCCNPVYKQQKIGTVGIPWPDVEIRIVDLESGTTDMPPGEPGELIARGPQVMKGYWQNSSAGIGELRDGWLYTGDIVTIDEDGYISIVDRKKDMVISSGFNVYPREIDEVLHGHPAILETCAIGVADEKRGQSIKVFVVCKAGSKMTEDELITYCRKDLAPYKIPKYVKFISELPRTSVGKPDRKALLAMEEAKK